MEGAVVKDCKDEKDKLKAESRSAWLKMGEKILVISEN